ncbi:hypothetical protein TRP8649_03703 [Pelagimonas phthalicica]|uniref:Uncharacterized protein n=1 Tax=Pelagimonas phthalicica TaxID=1037362 RepID=A0A238JIC3_9RHOB|nr:hypothetical protein [Pelagimonas phthalicica]TDS89260.1 hypothetical protein CLV87_4451 [Pelagimonas phthalicica]SMX29566.1 hypothetical protein TRP8649_03703 [Pelagimonas phthalicica]
MPYLIATALLLAFVANVAIGAVTKAPPVSNVVEMMILFGAAISFSIGILRSEAREQSKDKNPE